MAQLSLYIDEETLKKIETAAKLEDISVSKYVVRKLNETMSLSWPQSYEQLFGSIQDESFAVDRASEFSADSQREAL